ncbi:hypothetical protein IFM89_032266 [Coptis chinensis]|uniref:Hexosyltransferase n=1 Tax=Coptis chinensis TaxID=261450 RepID=A0A835M544_9MAGN|nr:hypothetical protein IFM89_032266 [Coptis chinensis]
MLTILMISCSLKSIAKWFILIDADIQAFENIDHLFDTPNRYFYAMIDCFCKKTWSHWPQYSVGYCHQCPDKVTWPAEIRSPPLYFNVGMFVYEPSRLTFEILLKILELNHCSNTLYRANFLNKYFKHVYKPILLVYNLVLAMLWRHLENVELEKVKLQWFTSVSL